MANLEILFLGRIFIFTVLITGAVVFWSYNAGLVSFLTVELFTFPITSFKVGKSIETFFVKL
jgi:uncharacterized membrane protein YoaK (UPF0700 family)